MNMQLNQEQLEGHFAKFQEYWNKEMQPQIIAKNVPDFDAGRMFENLWLDWKLEAEMNYLESSGQLDAML